MVWKQQLKKYLMMSKNQLTKLVHLIRFCHTSDIWRNEKNMTEITKMSVLRKLTDMGIVFCISQIQQCNGQSFFGLRSNKFGKFSENLQCTSRCPQPLKNVFSYPKHKVDWTIYAIMNLYNKILLVAVWKH